MLRLKMSMMLLVAVSILHAQDHSGHSANEYMHQRSTEELIERFESPERNEWQQPEKVIELMGDVTKKKVIDVGAGSGYFSFRLVDAGARVIAADVNDEFQAYIRKKKDELGIKDKQLETRLIPYDEPGLTDGEVDYILVVNTYHHIEDRVSYFAKAKKGLKKEGKLVIVDYFKKEMEKGPPMKHRISSAKVMEELKEAGYEEMDLDVNTLSYQYVIVAK